MNSDKKTQMSLIPASEFPSEPFQDDLLQRREIANRLSSYLSRRKDGYVIAIDAPWGEGKTWFGKNWAGDLQKNGHKVIFIDAFKQDYLEDPFLLISSAIAEAIKDPNEFRKNAAEVMKALLPYGAKVLINFAGKTLTGTANVSEQITEILEASDDITEKWIQKKIAEHSKEKESLENFRKKLGEFADTQEKPMVIIIDELDRCRPSFAVKFLERIKHFFEAPKIVFVLLIHKEQLESAIKGVYGSEIDAASYLQKFFSFSFSLPKHGAISPGRHIFTGPFVSKKITNEFLSKYKTDRDSTDGGKTIQALFEYQFTILVRLFNFSLRDIERAVDLFFLTLDETVQVHYGYIAYLIVLKIGKPKLFSRFVANSLDTRAHKEAKDQIDDLIIEGVASGMVNKNMETSLKVFSEWHGTFIGESRSSNEHLPDFSILISLLDLPVG